MTELRRIAGILTIILAIASILFSVFLFIRLWQIEIPLRDKLLSFISIFSDTLTTTEDGLDLMNNTLADASEDIYALQVATLAMADTLNDTGSTIDSLITVVDEDLPLTISNTQISLESAETTAAVIDEIMTGLSKIPFININYDPETPLSVALDEVSTSLENIPSSMESLSEDLSSTQESLEIFEEQVLDLANELDSLIDDIDQTHEVIDQYLDQIDRMQKITDSAQEELPGWLRRTGVFLTFLIIWLLISQIGLLIQGINLQNYETVQAHQTDE